MRCLFLVHYNMSIHFNPKQQSVICNYVLVLKSEANAEPLGFILFHMCCFYTSCGCSCNSQCLSGTSLWQSPKLGSCTGTKSPLNKHNQIPESQKPTWYPLQLPFRSVFTLYPLHFLKLPYASWLMFSHFFLTILTPWMSSVRGLLGHALLSSGSPDIYRESTHAHSSTSQMCSCSHSMYNRPLFLLSCPFNSTASLLLALPWLGWRLRPQSSSVWFNSMHPGQNFCLPPLNAMLVVVYSNWLTHRECSVVDCRERSAERGLR